jgi:hypothetical protein
VRVSFNRNLIEQTSDSLESERHRTLMDFTHITVEKDAKDSQDTKLSVRTYLLSGLISRSVNSLIISSSLAHRPSNLISRVFELFSLLGGRLIELFVFFLCLEVFAVFLFLRGLFPSKSNGKVFPMVSMIH